MTSDSASQFRLEPIVRWHRDMRIGHNHLVTVDLRLADPGEQWPYEEEELALTCMLDGADDFSVAAVHDASVLVHRFGGSYGPASFVVTPRKADGERSLWLTIVSPRGVPVRTYEVAVRVHPASEQSPAQTSAALAAVPVPSLPYPVSRRVAALTVELQPSGPGSDRFTAAAWLGQADSENDIVRLDSPDRASTLEQIRGEFDDIFTRARQISPGELLWVEFALPGDLIELPVDQWPVTLPTGGRRPIGAQYPVVVRNSTRPRDPDTRSIIRQRWERRREAVSTAEPQAIILDCTRPFDWDSVRGELGGGDEPGCVILDGPAPPGRLTVPSWKPW